MVRWTILKEKSNPHAREIADGILPINIALDVGGTFRILMNGSLWATRRGLYPCADVNVTKSST